MDAREHFLRIAQREGWPALSTRWGDIPAGQRAWRKFAGRASYLEMGTAAVALGVQALQARSGAPCRLN